MLEEYCFLIPAAAFLAVSSYAPPLEECSRLSAAINPQSVLIPPGSIRTTSIPNCLTSMRNASLNPSSAYLVA
ncbi:hypothetical protein D3C81_2099930 [compost metagenome]